MRQPRSEVPAVHAVVVHYGSTRDTAVLLASLAGCAPIRRITVVDNAAPVPVPEVPARVQVDRLPSNVGFAAACNHAASRVTEPYLLFANPDVELDGTALAALLSALDLPNVAAAAPRLILPRGHSQSGAAGHAPGVLNALGHAAFGARAGTRALFLTGDADKAADCDVDWLAGACLLLDRAAFESVGGFDPAYFLYGEDVDLGLRLRRAGWRLRFVPSVAVRHRHSSSVEADSGRAPSTEWLRGVDNCLRRHAPWRRPVIELILAAGFLTRGVLISAGLLRGRVATAVQLRRWGVQCVRLACGAS